MVKIDHKVQMTKIWSTQKFLEKFSLLLLFNLFAQFLRVLPKKKKKKKNWGRLQISLLIFSKFKQIN